MIDAIFSKLCCATPRAATLVPPKPPPPFWGFGGEDKAETQRKKEIEFIEAWLKKREKGDIGGAAADCTADMTIESPGAKSVVGLEEVKAKVFAKAAPTPLVILQPVQELPGQQHVYWRMAVFDFSGGKQTKIRREWHLVYDDTDSLKISKIVLKKQGETNGNTTYGVFPKPPSVSSPGRSSRGSNPTSG